MWVLAVTELFSVAFNYYRPQRSCGQGNIFTPVCHSVHKGGLPQCMLGYHPHPPEQTPAGSRPPWQQTPPREQTPSPPRTRHPPGPDTPPGSRLQHTVFERPVRILLECILVWYKEIYSSLRTH